MRTMIKLKKPWMGHPVGSILAVAKTMKNQLVDRGAAIQVFEPPLKEAKLEPEIEEDLELEPEPEPEPEEEKDVEPEIEPEVKKKPKAKKKPKKDKMIQSSKTK